MDPFFHTFIATTLLAVFFYSGYAYAWWRLRQLIVEHAANVGISIVFEDDDDENTPRDNRLG